MVHCPTCSSRQTQVFLKRPNVPVHQNLLINDYESSLKIPRGDLHLAFCRECGFVFNSAFDLCKLSYGQNYDNSQDYSLAFKDHLSSLIRHLVFEKNVKNCQIVEVGCGKGKFLEALVQDRSLNNIGYGFDPSYVGPEVLYDGQLNFQKCYYDKDCSKIDTDIVICRHVIEHISDPLQFLISIKQMLSNSPHARIFFETPCLEWILRNQVIWDFFYEHCSYFTKESLTTLFQKAGFQVESVIHVFGGQYLWLEASLPRSLVEVSKNAHLIPDLAEKFAAVEKNLISIWIKKVSNLLQDGKIALWGAGAKGVTFANLIDQSRVLFDSIIDLSPQKQGRYIAGTGHCIIDCRELPKRGIKTVILMNPNYYEENSYHLKREGIAVNLITCP